MARPRFELPSLLVARCDWCFALRRFVRLVPWFKLPMCARDADCPQKRSLLLSLVLWRGCKADCSRCNSETVDSRLCLAVLVCRVATRSHRPRGTTLGR